MGYKFIFIKSLKNKNDFKLLFKILYNKGYSRILVETGLTFLNTLIKNKLINDLYIFKTDRNLIKQGKNNNTFRYLKSITYKEISINLSNDKLYKREI